jgi:hypothetical protein
VGKIARSNVVERANDGRDFAHAVVRNARLHRVGKSPPALCLL